MPVYVYMEENGGFGERVHWLPNQPTFAVILRMVAWAVVQ